MKYQSACSGVLVLLQLERGGSRTRAAQTHLLSHDFYADSARNASVCISKPIAIPSHVPQLRKGGNALFHRHRRAGGLVRVFARRHSDALVPSQLSQVFSRDVVVQVVMMV